MNRAQQTNQHDKHGHEEEQIYVLPCAGRQAPETTGEMVKNTSCPGGLPIKRDKGLTPTQPNPTQPKQEKKE